MTALSFGDLAQSYALKSRIGRLKSDTIRLSTELSSGRISDIAASLSGDTTGLAAVERARKVTQGFITVSREAAQRADARQLALGVVTTVIGDLSHSVGALQQDSPADQVSRLVGIGRAGFGQAMKVLNTQFAGRPLFSGQSPTGPAVRDADSVLSALQGVVSGAVTAEDITQRISDWFDDPAGYEAFAYLGTEPSPGLTIAEDGTVITDRTANSAQIRKALSALSILAFLDHPGLTNSGPDRIALRDAALSQLSQASVSMNDLAAQIGTDQERIESMISRHEAASLSLELTLSETVGVDAARTAVELESVRTNLETVYAVTARLSRLTLTEFLR